VSGLSISKSRPKGHAMQSIVVGTAIALVNFTCGILHSQDYIKLDKLLNENADRIAVKQRVEELFAEAQGATNTFEALKGLAETVNQKVYSDVGKAVRVLALEIATHLGSENPKEFDFRFGEGFTYDAYNQGVASRYMKQPYKSKSRNAISKERKERQKMLEEKLIERQRVYEAAGDPDEKNRIP